MSYVLICSCWASVTAENLCAVTEFGLWLVWQGVICLCSAFTCCVWIQAYQKAGRFPVAKQHRTSCARSYHHGCRCNLSIPIYREVWLCMRSWQSLTLPKVLKQLVVKVSPWIFWGIRHAFRQAPFFAFLLRQSHLVPFRELVVLNFKNVESTVLSLPTIQSDLCDQCFACRDGGLLIRDYSW